MIKMSFISEYGKKLYIGIPFSQAISNSENPKNYEFNMDNAWDSAVYNFKTSNLLSPFPLSSLNFLNKMDYGHFYTIANSAFLPTETYLLSFYVFSNSKILPTTIPTGSYNFPSSSSFVSNDLIYLTTGDKLCWGSDSEGIVIILLIKVSNSYERKLSIMDWFNRSLLVLDILPNNRCDENQLL